MNGVSLLVLVGLEVIAVQTLLNESHLSEILLILVIHFHLIQEGFTQEISLLLVVLASLLLLDAQIMDVFVSEFSLFLSSNLSHKLFCSLFFENLVIVAQCVSPVSCSVLVVSLSSHVLSMLMSLKVSFSLSLGFSLFLLDWSYVSLMLIKSAFHPIIEVFIELVVLVLISVFLSLPIIDVLQVSLVHVILLIFLHLFHELSIV